MTEQLIRKAGAFLKDHGHDIDLKHPSDWIEDSPPIKDYKTLVRLLEKYAASPWISVQDRLPELGQLVPVIADGEILEYNCRYRGDGDFVDELQCHAAHNIGGAVESVTHWMPLPKLPDNV